MASQIALDLGFSTITARDRAVRRYIDAYDRLATDAQMLRAEGGKPLTAAVRRADAERVLRAIKNELNDPRPLGLEVSWLDAREAIGDGL